ncbi:TM35B protein, partial [Circaetus pectoralis]|nr:TM35B protein [Circaetus pectoralis]
SHPSQKSQFVRFADVFPLKEFGFAPEPGRYLEVVGWVEVVAGLLLAFGPQLLQEISNFILSVIMIGAIYTLLVLREPLAMCAPATLCLGLLLLLNIRGHAAPPK